MLGKPNFQQVKCQNKDNLNNQYRKQSLIANQNFQNNIYDYSQNSNINTQRSNGSNANSNSLTNKNQYTLRKNHLKGLNSYEKDHKYPYDKDSKYPYDKLNKPTYDYNLQSKNSFGLEKQNINIANNINQHTRQQSRSDNESRFMPSYTQNYISNGSIASSISHDQQQQNQFLKNKLIQTHQKLLKQLEISKQLEDNFFLLRKKYQNLQKKSLNDEDNIRRLSQQSKQLKQNLINQRQKYNSTKDRLYLKENQQLKQYNIKISRNLQDFKFQNQQLISNNQSLKSDLDLMRQKILQMITSKQNFQQKNSQNQQKFQQMGQKLNTLQQKLRTKERQFFEKQQLCQLWRRKHEKIQQQYKKLQQVFYKNEQSIKQLKSFSYEYQTALKQEKQKNAQMLSQIISVQMQAKQLKSKLFTCQQDKKTLQVKVIEQQGQKNVIQQKMQLQQKLQQFMNQYNNCLSVLKQKDKQILDLRNQYLEKQVQRINKEKHQKSNMNSVKMFVNKLEEQNRNLIKRQQIKHNNIRDQSKSPISKIHIKNQFNSKVLPNRNTNMQMYEQDQPQVYIYQDDGYQDSLQCQKAIPNINSQTIIMQSELTPTKIKSHCKTQVSVSKKKVPSILIIEDENQQMIKNSSQSKKPLRSYKQQKTQYLSLISQVGDLQNQLYNLNLEKNKILDQIDKIQNTKTKNKQIINKRRQYETMLIANDSKCNEIKQQLKKLRIII